MIYIYIYTHVYIYIYIYVIMLYYIMLYYILCYYCIRAGRVGGPVKSAKCRLARKVVTDDPGRCSDRGIGQ